MSRCAEGWRPGIDWAAMTARYYDSGRRDGYCDRPPRLTDDLAPALAKAYLAGYQRGQEDWLR